MCVHRIGCIRSLGIVGRDKCRFKITINGEGVGFGFLEVFKFDYGVFRELVNLSHVLAAIGEMVIECDASCESMNTMRTYIGSALMLSSSVDKSGYVFNPDIMTAFVLFQQQQINVFGSGPMLRKVNWADVIIFAIRIYV